MRGANRFLTPFLEAPVEGNLLDCSDLAFREALKDREGQLHGPWLRSVDGDCLSGWVVG
jgi:hypothetical protein